MPKQVSQKEAFLNLIDMLTRMDIREIRSINWEMTADYIDFDDYKKMITGSEVTIHIKLVHIK